MTPAVELHLHLEGAAPPAFIRALADEKGVDLSGIFDASGAYRYDGFVDFLRVYEAATSVLGRPEDYGRLTTAVLDECASNGVIYTEMFVSPDFCGGRHVGAWRDFLAAIHEAAEAHEVEMRVIVTCIRHFGPERALQTAACAAATAGDFVTGFGMGGDEAQGSKRDFALAFDCARDAGLCLTCHAGEWGGPESVRDALALGVRRIGHGVRAVEDAALVETLAEQRVVLEICPGSNIALGLYPSWEAHPIALLRTAGVPVTVSTDDPPFFHTTMRNEEARLREAFGWGDEVFTELHATAARAAFCDEETRGRLLRRITGSDASLEV